MAFSLLQLRTAVKEICNMENSDFAEPSEINRYINEEIADLYDLLVSKYENYYVNELSFSLSGSQDGYNIPVSFYKLLGIDKTDTSPVRSLAPYNFNERNNYNSPGAAGVVYSLLGSTINFKPAARAGGTYTVFFIPVAPTLSSDNQELDSILNSWSEYIITGAAVKVLLKEETECGALIAQKNRLAQRISAIAANRDAGRQKSIADVSEEYFDEYDSGYWRY